MGALRAQLEITPDSTGFVSITGTAYPAFSLPGPAGAPFIVSPGLLQKIYGARDEQAVRWGTAGMNRDALFLLCAGHYGHGGRGELSGLGNRELACRG